MKKIFIVLFTIFFVSHKLCYSQTAEEGEQAYIKAIEAEQQGNWPAANELYEEAATIFENLNMKTNVLKIRYQNSVLLIRTGDLKYAQTTLNNILEQTKDPQLFDAQLISACYTSLGRISAMYGKPDESLDYFEKALKSDSTQFGAESVQAAQAYANIGTAYSQKYEYTKAENFFNKAKQIFIKKEGEKTPNLINVDINLALISTYSGRYDDAIAIYKEAESIIPQGDGRFILQLADIYSGYCDAYTSKGEYNIAESYINKSLEIKKANFGENNINTVSDYSKLAILLKEQGKYDDAVNYFQKAGNIIAKNYGKKHPDLGGIYNNLAQIYFNDGDDETAKEYYTKAIESISAVYGDMHPDIAAINNNIALIDMKNKDYDNAIFNLQAAIQIYETNYGSRSVKLVEPYANIASAYFEKNEFRETIKFYKKSIEANMPEFNSPQENIFANPKFSTYKNGIKLIGSLKNKAAATLQYYDAIQDAELLHNVVECVYLTDSIIDDLRKSIVSENDKLLLSSISVDVYENGIYAAAKIYEIDRDFKSCSDAFYFSEKSKAGTLLEAMAGAKAQNFAGIPKQLIEKEKFLSEKMAYYKKQIAEDDDPSQQTKHRNQLFEYENQYRTLIKNFETDYPEYYNQKYSNKFINLNDVQALIPENTALVSYFTGTKYIYSISATKYTYSILASQKPDNFVTMIKEWREAITDYNIESFENYKNIAHEIYQIFFPQNLPKNTVNITIIPDGILSIVPFEAMLTDDYVGELKNFKDYPFLIKKYNISYNYSAFLTIARYKEPVNLDKFQWLGIAPVFDAANTTYFKDNQVPPIPETLNEISEIAKHLGEQKIITKMLIRKDADETNIKNIDLKQYKIIHIATHGTVNTENPELSGLFLSQDTTKKEDGMLYSGEIYNLKLNADLIILSACETGLGKIIKGEGVIGLGRALLYAGAKNIIASFWQVSDASTAVLMTNFYDNINKKAKRDNISFSENLYNAKLKMINEGKFAHPYFWSPFVIIGE